ncbi:MAG: YdiU family protein, partial [Planctomycetota bacterium]
MNTRWQHQLEDSYSALPEAMYTLTDPTPVASPKMVVFNDALADELGLGLSKLSEASLADLFSGNALPKNAKPLAQSYAGHQFGHFTMLGDGRAHLLGEHITPDGSRIDLQLKGSGRTPYSRGGDGRAVLGPMLREYLIAEAMHALGIPTTRSLAVVATGEPVQRETLLPGAILTRVATSHIRVGTFQFAGAMQDRTMLQALLDYTIERHDPDLMEADNKALALLDRVMHRQADLIVHWMRVGFIHGVMNTDNTVLSGETIDYGPCAFMDAYEPATVLSSIDVNGRYAYANQPAIIAWNLARLAEALLPLIHPNADEAVAIAEEKVNGFGDLYRDKWLTMMRSKLGLLGSDGGDYELISELLTWMKSNHADYTNTFRDLGGDIQLSGHP